jgi:broad specificity phosphatase PhoE
MIILIRHCSPRVNFSRCNHKQASERLEQYNTTNDIRLEEIEPFKEKIHHYCSQKNLQVFSSNLPRAVNTAKACFGEIKGTNIKDLFIEFDLEILPVPFLKFKFVTWLVIARIFWLLGITNFARNFSSERARAKECAEFLLNKAQTGPVALVAHQALNFFIERYLSKKGYKRISKVSNNCFSITEINLCKLP